MLATLDRNKKCKYCRMTDDEIQTLIHHTFLVHPEIIHDCIEAVGYKKN